MSHESHINTTQTKQQTTSKVPINNKICRLLENAHKICGSTEEESEQPELPVIDRIKRLIAVSRIGRFSFCGKDRVCSVRN